MKKRTGSIIALWRRFKSIPNTAAAALLLDELRLAVSAAEDEHEVRRISDQDWREWALTERAWWRDECVSAREAARTLRRRLRRGSSRAAAAVHGARAGLLLDVVIGLEVRCVADILAATLENPSTQARRDKQLRELGDTAVRLENRLRTRPASSVQVDVHWGKGLWRFHRGELDEAIREFRLMAEAADDYTDAARRLQAHCWLALALDQGGHSDRAHDEMLAALSKKRRPRERTPRYLRLIAFALAHQARLSRYMLAARDPQTYEILAANALDEAEELASEAGDGVLLATVNDFRGDLHFAHQRVAEARDAYESARAFAVAPGGSARSAAYVQYSLAKWLLRRKDPVRHRLGEREFEDLSTALLLARDIFERVGDAIGHSMVLLLEAEAHMQGNLGLALELLKQARSELRSHGPRRHLALAYFRSGEFVLVNGDRLGPFGDEDPVPYLCEATRMVQRLSMPDRWSLFREALSRLPVDAWIDMMTEVMARRRADPEPRIDHLKDAIRYLCHDYGHLLDAAGSRLLQAGDLSDITPTVNVVRLILDEMRSESELIGGRDPLGQRQIGPLDVEATLRDIADTYASISLLPVSNQPGRNIPQVRGDRGLVSRILFNLLVNAEQAILLSRCQEESEGVRTEEIILRASVMKRGEVPHFVEISVEDTGPGIDPAIADRLFEEGRSRFPKGKGLGLAFCLRAARAMQARVYVKNSGGDGKGATFALRLRVASVRGRKVSRTRPA